MIKGSLEYFELAEYIDQLTLATKDLSCNIINNLKGYGLGDEASEITKEVIDKVILLAPATGRYNCYGWSLGVVTKPDILHIRESFLEDIILSKKQKVIKIQTDPTMHTFFSIEGSQLVENTASVPTEGNVAIYSNKNKQIIHSAKYVRTLGWYHYEEELYKDWYDRDRGCVRFDETGKVCTIESYTSKLGLGHLIAHDLEDIMPLYGVADGFFDLVL